MLQIFLQTYNRILIFRFISMIQIEIINNKNKKRGQYIPSLKIYLHLDSYYNLPDTLKISSFFSYSDEIYFV